MHKLIKDDRTVYLLEDGVLKLMGEVEDMICVCHGIYRVGCDIFKKDGDKFDLIAEDVHVYPVHCNARPSANQTISLLSTARCAVDKKKIDPVLLAKYSEILARQDRTKADQGVVVYFSRSHISGEFIPSKRAKLLFAKEGFIPNQGEELFDIGYVDIDKLNPEHVTFLDAMTFIYLDMVYTYGGVELVSYDFGQRKVESGYCARIYQSLVLSAKNYLLFWGGCSRIFALEQGGSRTVLNTLGDLVSFIKTDVSDLIIVSEHRKNGMFALYHLGESLELLARFEILGNCNIDIQTGDVSVHRSYMKLDENGYPIIREDGEYVFVKEDTDFILINDHYEPSVF